MNGDSDLRGCAAVFWLLALALACVVAFGALSLPHDVGTPLVFFGFPALATLIGCASGCSSGKIRSIAGLAGTMIVTFLFFLACVFIGTIVIFQFIAPLFR